MKIKKLPFSVSENSSLLFVEGSMTSAAAVTATAAAASAVVMTVASAAAAGAGTFLGEERKLTEHHQLSGIIGIAAEAGESNYAVLGECLTCALTDVTYDNNVNTVCIHEIRNCLMTGFCDLNELFALKRGVVGIGVVDGELLGMTEMFENLSILV